MTENGTGDVRREGISVASESGQSGTAGAEGPIPMRQSSQLLEIQRDLAIELLAVAGLSECLDCLLRSAMRLPGFDCGGIYLYDEESRSMRLSAHRGLSEDFVKRVSKYPADSPQAKMVGAGNLVYSMRSDLPREIAQAIATEGLEALAVLPLRDGGRVVAALNVSSHRYPCIEQGSRVALESLVAQAGWPLPRSVNGKPGSSPRGACGWRWRARSWELGWRISIAEHSKPRNTPGTCMEWQPKRR